MTTSSSAPREITTRDELLALPGGSIFIEYPHDSWAEPWAVFYGDKQLCYPVSPNDESENPTRLVDVALPVLLVWTSPTH